MRILFLRPEGSKVPIIPGHEVINIPLFKPVCIEYDSKKIESYESIAFTSVNAIKCFKDFDKIQNKKILSIGKSTFAELRSKGITSIFPKDYDSINLAYLALHMKIKSLLAIRSKKASEDMKNILSDKMAYDEIYDYDLILNEENVNKAIDILNCKVDVVVITSSEIAKTVAKFLKNECYKIVTIGPMTTKSLLQLRNDIQIYQSRKYDIDGIVELISEITRV
ncbi:uroporphyrinogen-III synthase [Acidianus sulfidivorans JP7]|uniref:Uroporphyrinogen-III synthase n=1 Tax=Acidianus sulfidivorans JP7 TaxID=619593 RepID=A0A2U9IMU2_9CREN|nr:uroporphyrinogen-III synthase [Acidianus sulfidivorans]AWR97342.1 uroporphyrinogen-III synthase [Acidianus sulfidivorans JP7]